MTEQIPQTLAEAIIPKKPESSVVVNKTNDTFKFGHLMVGIAWKCKLGIFLDKEKADAMVEEVYKSYPPDHRQRLMPVQVFILKDANQPDLFFELTQVEVVE